MAGIKDLKPKRGQFKQGYYEPTYPQKYKTNTKQIIYRSSWELKLCRWFDLTPEVIEWASEPVSIKYLFILDNKIHTYYPDFYFAYRKDDGTILKYIVEVKPKKQLTRPNEPKRKTQKAIQNYLHDKEVFIKNMCKRKYATEWCNQNGYKYVYVTEESNLNFL